MARGEEGGISSAEGTGEVPNGCGFATLLGGVVAGVAWWQPVR